MMGVCVRGGLGATTFVVVAVRYRAPYDPVSGETGLVPRRELK